MSKSITPEAKKGFSVAQDRDLWWRVTDDGRMLPAIYRTKAAALSAMRARIARRFF